MKLGLTILRVLVGGLFVGHGTQKLFGWFGGHGLEGTSGFLEGQLGLKPGKRAAIAAGAAEAGGGVLIATGLLTPVGSAAIIGSMAQAIRTVHAPKGPWVTDGGWEYNAVLIAAMVALADLGPGDVSLDHALGFDRLAGPVVALAALAAGIAGPELLLEKRGEDSAEPEPAETPGA